MYKFNNEYEKELAIYWNKYIKTNIPLPENHGIVRPFIYASWKRSKELNVSPTAVQNTSLPPEELSQILKKNKQLIAVAHPYLLSMYKYVKGTNFVFALTDSEGTVIDYVGCDKAISSRTKKSGLQIGTNRSEKYAGTCGIGTCLATGMPVQIWGFEHFIAPHHNYTGSAAPIHDSDGNIIGCLDAVGPKEISPIHTLPMVHACVDGIQKELKITEALDKINLGHKQVSSILQAIGSGILMVDNDGTVTQYNNNAVRLLSLDGISLIGRNLSDFFSLSSANINLLAIEKPLFNKEFSVLRHNGTRMSFNMSATLVYNSNGEKNSTVIVLDEIKEIHKLASKISGFSAKYTFDSIIEDSESMRNVKYLGNIAAQSNSTVLILGESGTGKELLAQAIHNASDRASNPFIAINCGSLPKGLIESELFGYEKGAFTGANKDGQPGKFELADGGTIFLDEIGDMPLELQTVLLRVLQNREIIRVGGTFSKPIDVRIIAATNANLLQAVADKRFRNDLYYRLNVLSINVPPLRSKKEDIPVLAKHFLTSVSKRLSKHVYSIDEQAMLLFLQYSWPGNVRELENVVERAVNITNSGVIHVEDLPSEITGTMNTSMQKPLPLVTNTEDTLRSPLSSGSTKDQNLARLIDALTESHGNITMVSKALQIPRRTLYRKLEKYNINPKDFRFL